MRPILFVLLAVAAGEALPPDAVPVMCAAICGPIVELSSMCSPKRSLWDLDSHKLEVRAHAGHAKRHNGRHIEDERREKRFSVIVPAPTTFPPNLVGESYVPASSPASWETTPAPAQPPAQNYAPPTQPQSTPAPAPAPTPTTTPSNWSPSPASVASSSTTSRSVQQPTASMVTKKESAALPATTSRHRTSGMPAETVSDGSGGGMTDGQEEIENAEERCVCLNTSFNVAEIAGLCASCIGMVADTQNNMQVIMSVCGFPSQQYSPDKDKLASNIWVKATRPTAGVKTNGASRSTRLASIGVIVGVGFTTGALMML